jgi:hypothetical protein
MTPLMTLFSVTKPFTNPHIATIQRNAIRSWQQLGPEVEIVLIGNEAGMAEAAAELGVLHLPQVACNSQGTPYLHSAFELARQVNDSPLLAYTNGDMLYMPDFLEAARRVMTLAPHFLIVSCRWDLDVKEPLDFSAGWVERLNDRLDHYGKAHSPVGSDLFIYPRTCYVDFPHFIAGRSAWDNWMIYEARQRGWCAVDASDTLRVIHQNHDYSHLPNNQPPYRLPETAENIRLAGGDASIFFLRDCNYHLIHGRLQHPKMTWQRFWREAEIFPLVKLHWRWLGYLFYYLRRPQKGYKVFRHWVVFHLLRRAQATKG